MSCSSVEKDAVAHEYVSDTYTKGTTQKLFSARKRARVGQADVGTYYTDTGFNPSRNVAFGGHRGVAVIINNETFQLPELKRRLGTEADKESLKRLFEKLDFDVQVHQNVTALEIRRIVEDAAAIDHSNYDCFVMVFLSHGENGVIYGTDGTIEIKPLTEKFDGKNCPKLIGKHKVFIFQACRGSQDEVPVHVNVHSVQRDGDDEEGTKNEMMMDGAGVALTLPNGSDFLFCYSVCEGFSSYRDRVSGSWYIQCMVKVFEKELFTKGHQSAAKQDILSLLTLVNSEVAKMTVDWNENEQGEVEKKSKQMPCFMSMLTEKFYLVKRRSHAQYSHAAPVARTYHPYPRPRVSAASVEIDAPGATHSRRASASSRTRAYRSQPRKNEL